MHSLDQPASDWDAQSVLDLIDGFPKRSSTLTAWLTIKKMSSSRPVSRPKPHTSSHGP
ncbi:hypothetical protein PGT21_033878 [Puccinia graminis f. sp. tritici]|uniref:Uncharacterized protein n=1 Tax=Puccinia graminis f. sp. tritici TaxID=56615 RepID=A0A5B0R2E9_PUCGR|nr:hypothetical protein PGT21_033878 [Puccinia graminis f. sp. tritici]